MSVLPRLFALPFAAAAGCMAAETSLLSEFTVRRWSVADGLPEAAVTSIEQRADGYLWCATARHLLRFDGVRFVEMTAPHPPPASPPTVTKIPPGMTAGEVTATMPGADDSLWIGTARGLFRWQAGLWTDLTARDGVYPVDVRCLAQDRERNVWVGTSGGLVRLRRRAVTVFRTGLGVGSQAITAILAQSATNFLVGVAGGGLLAGPPDALRPMPVKELPENATVSALCLGRDGTLWIGTQGDFLLRRRPEGAVSVIRQSPDSRISAQGISALLEDRHGRLWVGTWEGLMQLSPAGHLVPVALRVEKAANNRSLHDPVLALCEDPAGRMWVGYQRSGLIRIGAKSRAEQFHEDVGVLAGSLFALHWDPAGTLWIGSSHGLGRWHADECRQFTAANGLVDNVVLQVLEDKAGDLWLGCRQGLMRIRKSEFDDIIAGRRQVAAVRHLGAEAGMVDEECTGQFGARAARTDDGRLWFPTLGGIAMVDPGRIAPQAAPPAIYVEEIRVEGDAVPFPKSLRLPLGQRNIEFLVTAPVFTAPERAHFKFQLEGHDTGWSRATAERTATYPALDPGTYRFRAMARDRDSPWSEPSEAVVLTLPPFFWETTGFWILVGAAAVAAAAVAVRIYYRVHTARQLEQMERRHALERERSRIARDIHDDVGAGLTEVAMLSELAQDKQGRPPELREHLDAIFRRAREMAQSLDEIVWAINPANDTLEGFLSFVGEYAQGFLAAAGIACRLDFPAEPPTVTITATVRHHLCLALKEALHNIAKHAGASEVHVAVAVALRELTIETRDNGRGFVVDVAPGPESGRDGLANLRARLAEIGGRVRHESCQGGTRTVFSVQLPIAEAVAPEQR